MSTVKEGAACSGWPFTTVSRLIDPSGPVRARVSHFLTAAAKCLQPVPRALGRGFGQSVSRSIGLLIVDNTHPFFAELVRGIEDVCYRHRYTVTLCNSYNDPERQEAHLRKLLETRVDGQIVAAVEEFGPVARQLSSAGVPIVFVDRHVPGVDADTVQVNHGQGGYRATRHLGIGALRCAAARGIVVPRDLSIVGFDGVEIGQYLSPALTSIGQPTRCLGELAATSLLERVHYGGYRPFRDVMLPPELIIRESTGPAPS